MAKSAADIAAGMIAALAVTDPEMDTSIGSTVRKWIDVAAEQIAPAYALTDLDQWIYTIDTKEGAALDDFCTLFGIYRIAAKRATGTIQFTRPNVATTNIPIPAGTVVATGSTPTITFVTVSAVWLLKGTSSVIAPIQAVNAGVSGNLPVGSITLLGSNLSGISNTLVQPDATSGGTDAESDASLRTRFRQMIFHSMAGTQDMFLGVALEDSTPDDTTDVTATAATVLGATKRWREQVQVDGTGLAVSTMPTETAKYVYTGTSIFGPDIDGGQILTEDVHYSFDAGAVPPEVHDISGNLTEGTVYDLDFEYVSAASRNDPASGITNRVDIWVAGVAPETGSENTYYQPQTFDSTTDSEWFTGKFLRLSDSGEVPPAAGNAFLQLAWGPIVDFPSQIIIGGDAYVRDTDFWVVQDDTAFGYGPDSKFGLEFPAGAQPATNAQIRLTGEQAYVYNRLPRDAQARAEAWKLVTTDVKAHAAKQVRLRLNIGIMYAPSYERGVVQAGVDAAVAAWMDGLGFRSVVQVSDILQTIHNVDGVDNVKFLASDEPVFSDDADSWGIEKVSTDGTNLTNFGYGSGTLRAMDVVLSDNEVPVLYDIRYVTKAQNTWQGA